MKFCTPPPQSNVFTPKRTKHELTTFKIKQAIGSMAIEGIYVSPQTQKTMESVATGKVSAIDVKRDLIAKYRSLAQAGIPQ